jgi:hypothetical protein
MARDVDEVDRAWTGLNMERRKQGEETFPARRRGIPKAKAKANQVWPRKSKSKRLKREHQVDWPGPEEQTKTGPKCRESREHMQTTHFRGSDGE